MDARRKDALTKARFDLSSKMQSLPEICDYLVSAGELTDALIDEINSKGTKTKQNSELLKIIATRGDSAYDAFRNALIETKAQKFLLEKLPDFSPQNERSVRDETEATRRVTPPPSSTGSSSPASVNSNYILSSLQDDLLQKLDEVHIDTTDSRPTSDLGAYPVDPDHPGLALVINNVHFDHMRERQGSDVDEHNIKLLLRAYNFQIFEDGRTRDLNMNRMTDVIERFSQLRDHQRYSCSIVIVLTHGQDGYLFATDSYRNNLVSVKWMLELFQGNNCPNLNGKPKLFFLQACRGELMDKGADLYGHDATDAADEAMPPVAQGDASNPDEILYKKLIKQNYDEVDAITRGDVVASHSDIFIAYATVPGYVSWRNSANGSWFIQAIVRVFPRYSNAQDLVSMMTEVNRLVQEKFKSSSGDFKMTPSQTTQLTHKFYFPASRRR